MSLSQSNRRQTPESARGQVVKVYSNFHRKCLSIVLNGRVIGHADKVYLAEVTFKVSAAGWQRATQERQKNVHAWAIGVLLGWENGRVSSDPGINTVVYYNPWVSGPTFYRDDTGEPVSGARSAAVYPLHVHARNVY